eukprot:3005756-Rhodomonas_salina.1
MARAHVLARKKKEKKEKKKELPPKEAKLLGGDSKSLLNIHCATWRDHRGDKSVDEQKRFLAKCMSVPPRAPPPLPPNARVACQDLSAVALWPVSGCELLCSCKSL